MLDTDKLEELAKKLYASLPSGIQNLEQEVQQKFKEILKTALSNLDIITREEFDVQTKVLARTREKVEELQAQLDELVKLQIKNKKNDIV